MTNLPIACTLGPDALEARREGLLLDVVRRAQRIDTRADGYRLEFANDDDVLPLLAQAVALERHCCRFLRFTINVDPDGGPVSLELTGPPGTAEFLSSLLNG